MTTCVVVGSGVAGLTAALHAAAAGARVTIVTKARIDEANTRYAQGGIAAVTTKDDTVGAHAADTLRAGGGLGDPEAVRILTSGAPARIAELIAAGVPFDRAPDGTLRRGLEAAHSSARILHAGGDATGAAIQAALVDAVRARGIEVREHTALVDLVLTDGAATGVVLLHDGRRTVLRADAVILATGGAGQLYARTTNPRIATGDGIAAAMRAGAVVADLEFVQFHPTVLAVGEPFLVSEAVRGEGATLRDVDGRRFAFDTHPDGELAPRDVVARAIARRAAEQGAEVLLDATALGAGTLAERFPTIDAAVRARGLDWSQHPIPITPAAHYLMGGVVTDLDGRTSIPGLYAVGEVARTGVHGANRLASNSLLEGAVFGARAGDAAAAGTPGSCTPVGSVVQESTRAADTPSPAPVPRQVSPFTRAALQQLMWEEAGLFRDEIGLDRAAATLAAWADDVGAEPASVTALEDRNLVLVAAGVVAAAQRRTASVGAHFRTDDPTTRVAAPAAVTIGAA